MEAEILTKIESILNNESESSRRWFERNPLLPRNALGLCNAAISSVRRQVLEAAESPSLISFKELLQSLETNRYEQLESLYDEEGFASGTYASVIRDLKSLL